MKNERTTRMAWVLWALALVLGWGAAGEAAVPLGKRYVNVLHGFSFASPMGARRKHDFSRSRLISWTGRDKATGAIAWTLTVTHVAEVKSKDVPLGTYMNALVAKLKKEENFTIEASKLVRKTCGKRRYQFAGEV